MAGYTSPNGELPGRIHDQIDVALEEEGKEAQRALASALVKGIRALDGITSTGHKYLLEEDAIKVILEESGFALDELDE